MALNINDVNRCFPKSSQILFMVSKYLVGCTKHIPTQVKCYSQQHIIKTSILLSQK